MDPNRLSSVHWKRPAGLSVPFVGASLNDPTLGPPWKSHRFYLRILMNQLSFERRVPHPPVGVNGETLKVSPSTFSMTTCWPVCRG